MGGFHHRVARRLTGRQPRKGRNRVLVYPPMEYIMAEAGFQEAETYFYRFQNTMAQYITTRTIMDLCMAAERRPGPRVFMRWW